MIFIFQIQGSLYKPFTLWIGHEPSRTVGGARLALRLKARDGRGSAAQLSQGTPPDPEPVTAITIGDNQEIPIPFELVITGMRSSSCTSEEMSTGLCH